MREEPLRRLEACEIGPECHHAAGSVTMRSACKRPQACPNNCCQPSPSDALAVLNWLVGLIKWRDRAVLALQPQERRGPNGTLAKAAVSAHAATASLQKCY